MAEPRNERCDVVVVGAGPTGLVLAAQLAKQGSRVRIVDQADVRAPLSRAIGLHARTLELFDGMGILDRFLEIGHPVHAIEIFADGEPLVSHRMEDVESEHPFILDMPQSSIERVLEGYLEEWNVTVERTSALVDLGKDGEEAVTAVVRRGDGRHDHLRAKYLVGCDGAGSTVREELGLAYSGDDYPETYYLADVAMNWGRDDDSWRFYYSAEGALLFYPFGGGRWRIIATRSSDEMPALNRETIEELARERGAPDISIEGIHWTGRYQTRRRMAQQFRSGRVFLAGDAAHCQSLAGNQGMNTGIQDACNLAWKLHAAVKDRARPRILDSYCEEREGAARKAAGFAARLRSIALVDDPVLRRMRDLVVPTLSGLAFVQGRILGRLEETRTHYRQSSIVEGVIHADAEERLVKPFHDGPQAGDRAPLGALVHAETGEPIPFVRALSDICHTLVAFVTYASPPEVFTELRRALIGCREYFPGEVYPILVSGRRARRELDELAVDNFLDPRHTLHHRYGTDRESLYLIRPDGYIAYRAMPPQADALFSYLRDCFH